MNDQTQTGGDEMGHVQPLAAVIDPATILASLSEANRDALTAYVLWTHILKDPADRGDMFSPMWKRCRPWLEAGNTVELLKDGTLPAQVVGVIWNDPASMFSLDGHLGRIRDHLEAGGWVRHMKGTPGNGYGCIDGVTQTIQTTAEPLRPFPVSEVSAQDREEAQYCIGWTCCE